MLLTEKKVYLYVLDKIDCLGEESEGVNVVNLTGLKISLEKLNLCIAVSIYNVEKIIISTLYRNGLSF